MPSKVSSAYRSPKPQPLYTDPTIGAGASNLGALIFGDPAAIAKRQLDAQHGKYYEAAAGNQTAEAELRRGQAAARAGIGGRLAQLGGVPPQVADVIASMVQGGGINDTSVHAAQTLNTVTGGQMMRDTVAPQAPGAPAPNVNAVEQLSRVAALLMNGGTHLPTEKTTVTPNYQDTQIANAEDNANYRQEYASDSSKAGQLGAAKIGADQRERSNKYAVDNPVVNAGPGHIVTTSPNSAFGERVFNGPPQAGRAGEKSLPEIDALRVQATQPGPAGDEARRRLGAFRQVDSEKIGVQDSKNAGTANVAKINVNGRQMVETTRAKAMLDKTSMEVDGRYYVQELKNEGALAVQDGRNEGALATQDSRNAGALAVQGSRNAGNETVATIAGDARRDVAETGAGARVTSSENAADATVTAAGIGARGRTDAAAINADGGANVANINARGRTDAATIAGNARTDSATISGDASRDVAETNAGGRVDAAATRAAGAGKPRPLNDKQRLEMDKLFRDALDRQMGVQRDKGAVVGDNYPLEPEVENEVITRAIGHYAGDDQVDPALAVGKALREVTGGAKLSRPALIFGMGSSGSYATPGGVPRGQFKPPPSSGPGRMVGAQPPAGQAVDPLAEARAAIAKGAPRAAVEAEMIRMGLDPSGL